MKKRWQCRLAKFLLFSRYSATWFALVTEIKNIMFFREIFISNQMIFRFILQPKILGFDLNFQSACFQWRHQNELAEKKNAQASLTFVALKLKVLQKNSRKTLKFDRKLDRKISFAAHPRFSCCMHIFII